MTIMVENVEPRGGHLHYEGLTDPLRPSVLDIKKQQLPYEGKLSARSNQKLCDGINFALLEEAGQKSEGKLLLAALTGGRLVKKKIMPLLPPLQDHGQGLDKSPRRRNEADVKGGGDDKAKSFERAVTTRSGVSDKAVDTSDLLKTLQRLAGEPNKPEPPTAWLFDNEEERANYDRSMEPPTAIETISLSAYLKTIKDSKKQIHIRTDILDELKLSENVEEIDVSVYVEPTEPKSAGAADPAGAMCATSLVIKYARRLAGILESDTRVMNLTDVGIWLEQLSRIAAVKEENIELPDMPRRVSELEKRTADWRLPRSPEIAVMYAQDDLRKRFDMETRRERYMRRRKAELAAAKKLVEQKAKEMADEKKMQEYLASLDSTAAEAELTAYDKKTAKAIGDGEGDGGGSGFDEGDGGGSGFDERDGGDTDYKSWTRYSEPHGRCEPYGRVEHYGRGEPYGNGEPSLGDGKKKISEKRKKGNLGKSGGRRGRGRRYGGVTSGLGSSNLFEKEKAQASSEYSGCSSASSSRGGEGGAASLTYERRTQRSASAHRKFVDTYTGVSESEEIVCCPQGEKKTLRTIGVETDCEMEENLLRFIEDDVDDAPAQPVDAADGAAELARMRREMIKLKRQLRFWRARSWVTQHRALLATKPAKTVTKSQTEMDLRTMHTRKEPDADAMVQASRVQEFLIPKLPLSFLEPQNQALTNPHLLSARCTNVTRSGSKPGSTLKYAPWSGQKPQSSYASPRFTLKPLEVVGKKSPGQVAPRLYSLEPMRRMISPLRTVRETKLVPWCFKVFPSTMNRCYETESQVARACDYKEYCQPKKLP